MSESVDLDHALDVLERYQERSARFHAWQARWSWSRWVIPGYTALFVRGWAATIRGIIRDTLED